jgi:hypothetical protein
MVVVPMTKGRSITTITLAGRRGGSATVALVRGEMEEKQI